ncbi:MAG: DUF87 domain-containing protein [Treponema sp.]|nr:DUF87 domain-containing protein [Treponema sp.]
MKFLTKTIIGQIKNNLPSSEEEMMVKINGFSYPKIYKELADSISKFCSENNITCNIKLANNKYNDFYEKNIELPSLDSMKQNEWVALEQSITYYRNLHDSKLLVLLGTEEEDDKDGLLNCSEITPESLARNLDGKYSEIFKTALGDIFNSDEENVINKLYKDLFEYVPADICKLSKIADDWTDVSNIDEFIERFYLSLPEWKLPFRKDNLRTQREILRNNKNILQIEYSIISHSLFNDLSKSKFDEYLKKFSEYECSTDSENPGETGRYADSSFDWSNQSVDSYGEYVSLLTDFISSNDIERNREKLLGCDISIAEDIFNLKLEKEKKQSKKSEIALGGSPIKVFTQILLNSLVNAKNEQLDFSKFKIEIKKVSLVTGYSENETSDSDDALVQAWKNVCVHTNGITDYIQHNRQWKCNDNDISIDISPADIFNPQICDKNIVEATSSSKKNSSIEMEITCFDSNGSSIKDLKQKYKWNFTNNEAWINEFSEMAASEILENEEYYIPLSELKNIKDLICSSSEEEFFDLISNSDLSLKKEFDICNYVCDKLKSSSDSDIKINAAFIELGSAFIKFGKDIRDKGYYNLLISNDSSMFKFVQNYKELGKLIVKEILPDNRKWVYDAFIHSFCIEENENSVRAESETDCCIVPPWNPVTLEKLNDQKTFFLDGCNEWWENISDKSSSSKKIEPLMETLLEMSVVKNSVVVFPASGQKLFGSINSFGSYSLYASDTFENESRVRDLIQKDLIFDDTFTNDELIGISENSKMILNLINSYTRSFVHAKTNLKLVFINPGELQPVVSAVYNYVKCFRKNDKDSQISIELHILIKPENRGGKNYLSYWMNEFFSEDEHTSVKTYLNEWSNMSELISLIEPNNDILFFMDFLKSNDFKFYSSKESAREISSCKFPVVYKPRLVSNTSGSKRSVELSQPQFKAEQIHTQAVYYRKENIKVFDNEFIAAQEMKFDDESYDTVYKLHSKGNWIICIDSGLDGALLKKENGSHSKDYSIIGFSTGNGNYGKYNITITARKEMLKIIEDSFKTRLSRLFHWESKLIDSVVSRCMAEAAGLDGISLLSAINLKDNNINEFMAYVLTSFREKSLAKNSPLKVLIHLDSYKHWFTDEIIDELDNSASRTDFLVLEISDFKNDKLVIDANVVECKISTIKNADGHKEKAVKQVNHSLKRLQQIFDPNSTSVLRRYWYAQLYRALTFAQVTFANTSGDYEEIAEKLRLVLNGCFKITWKGEVLGYWVDSDGDNEIIENSMSDEGNIPIAIHNIPQKMMQEILVDDSLYSANFVSGVDENLLMTKEEKEEFNKENGQTDEFTDDSTDKSSESSDSSEQKELKSFETSALVKSSKENESNQNTEPVSSTNTSDANQKNEAETACNTENSVQSAQNALSDVRVLVGNDKQSQKVYWEFGNPKLTNRHLLITGTSGQGKTYCIQALLYELTKSNISSVIFDYTEGFRLDQVDEEFKEKIGVKLKQRIVKVEKVPVNPFKIFEQDIAGTILPETSVDVANRLKSIFSHVYNFGPQQESAVYEAVKNGIDKYGEQMNMDLFIQELSSVKNKSVDTVISKVKPFTDAVEFDVSSNFDWESIVYPKDSQCFVFQLTAYDRDTQVIITELLLWNLWYYSNKNGNKDKPFVVVLDEAQNLSHKKGSPSEKILTEGRKFGWSAWFATQSLQVLNDDEVTRLLQSAFKLYFKPTDAEMIKMAKQLDPQDSSRFLGTLKSLNKGQCIVVGDRCNASGNFTVTRPTVTNVTSLIKR